MGLQALNRWIVAALLSVLVFGPAVSADFGFPYTIVDKTKLAKLNQCDSTSSSFTWDGAGGSTSTLTLVTCYFGKWVMLFIPTCQATTGTSSTVLTSNTALPTAARPLTGTQQVSVNSLRNSGGDTHAGLIQINTTGIIQIFRDNASTAFSNGVNAGISSSGSYIYYVGTGS